MSNRSNVKHARRERNARPDDESLRAFIFRSSNNFISPLSKSILHHCRFAVFNCDYRDFFRARTKLKEMNLRECRGKELIIFSRGIHRTRETATFYALCKYSNFIIVNIFSSFFNFTREKYKLIGCLLSFVQNVRTCNVFSVFLLAFLTLRELYSLAATNVHRGRVNVSGRWCNVTDLFRRVGRGPAHYNNANTFARVCISVCVCVCVHAPQCVILMRTVAEKSASLKERS